MSAHAAVYARLSATAAVTALVAGRVFPDVLPDNPVYPAVTFEQTAGSSERGAQTDPLLLMARMQITAWAKSRVQARALADQLRRTLDRMRLATVGGAFVNDCFFEGEVDLYDPAVKVYYTALDFRLHFKDAA